MPNFKEFDWLQSNPYLSKEELAAFSNFFKLFTSEGNLASIDRMVESLENMSDMNTGVIRKVLLNIRTMGGGSSDFKSNQF